MSDPFTWTATTWAMIGAGVSAVSAISSASQQKSAAEYNAKVAENQAIATRQQAEANAQMQERQSRLKIGKMQSTYAASGITSEGSPMEILEQSAREAELDRMNILWRGETGATGLENTATLDKYKAGNAMTSGYLSAAGSIFSGASKAMGGTSGTTQDFDWIQKG